MNTRRALFVWSVATAIGGCIYTGEGTAGLPCTDDSDCDAHACVDAVCGGSAALAGSESGESEESGAMGSDDGGEVPTEQEFEELCTPGESQACVGSSSIRWCTDDRKLVTYRCEALCGEGNPVEGGCQTNPDDGVDLCWCQSNGGPPSGTCTDVCSYDSDCSSGERCLSTLDGNLCMPSSCAGCFSAGVSCSFYTHSCKFAECS